jgi:hypothetical protein
MTEFLQHSKLSSVVIPLLKGIVFRDEQPTLWQDLFDLENEVRDYIAVLGLDLQIDDNEGFAWLFQQAISVDENADKEKSLPRLMMRRQLSYPISLLCVLLRKKLVEADATGDSPRVIVSRQELQNSMRVFMPEKSNEAQTTEQIITTINKVIELGFLRKLKSDEENLEIQRIIIALVDADWVSALNEKLTIYQNYAHNTA